MQWFGKRYPAEIAAIPVMIHPQKKLHTSATGPTGMRVINDRALGELIADLRTFSEGLAAEGWNDLATVSRLLHGHKLDATALGARLAPTTGGTS